MAKEKKEKQEKKEEASASSGKSWFERAAEGVVNYFEPKIQGGIEIKIENYIKGASGGWLGKIMTANPGMIDAVIGGMSTLLQEWKPKSIAVRTIQQTMRVVPNVLARQMARIKKGEILSVDLRTASPAVAKDLESFVKFIVLLTKVTATDELGNLRALDKVRMTAFLSWFDALDPTRQEAMIEAGLNMDVAQLKAFVQFDAGAKAKIVDKITERKLEVEAKKLEADEKARLEKQRLETEAAEKEVELDLRRTQVKQEILERKDRNDRRRLDRHERLMREKADLDATKPSWWKKIF